MELAGRRGQFEVITIDRRLTRREQRNQVRLRPLQMKGNLVIAIGRDLFDVAVPGFPGVDSKLVGVRPAQPVPDELAPCASGCGRLTWPGQSCGPCRTGRGEGLFGEPNHDAAALGESLALSSVAGFFCNGEIGPVGTRNYLHGYTASIALIVPT